MAYTKGETLKLTMFWSTIIAIIFYFISCAIAVGKGDYVATVVMFAIGVVCTLIAVGIWLYVKVKKTNRKLTT